MSLDGDHFKLAAQTLYVGLSKALDDVAGLDFPSEEPSRLIALIRDILCKINLQIESGSSPEKLRNIIIVLREFGSIPADLGGARSAKSPRALVQIVEELLSGLLPNSQLIAYPQDSYNFQLENLLSYLEQTTEYLLKKSEKREIFGPFKNREINLISFPLLQRDDVLMYPILGHEIGHPIAEEFFQREYAQKSYKNKQTQIVRRLERHLNENNYSKSDAFRHKKNYMSDILHIRKRGMEELISDTVATAIFGPSALFAFNDLFSADALDSLPDSPEYYPPSRYRLRNITKLLEADSLLEDIVHINEPNEIKVTQKLKRFCDHMRETVSIDTDLSELQEYYTVREAYKWIQDTLPQAIRFVKKRVRDSLYRSKLTCREIPELLDRLAIGVPPNEVGRYKDATTADWRSAILAGWVYKIQDLSLPKKGNEKLNYDSIIRLQNIVKKAIEYIVLTNSYSNYVESKGSKV